MINKANGYIDSASIYEVLLALERSDPTESYPLGWNTALNVTSAVMSAKKLRVAPAPASEGGAGGSYSQIMKGLASIASVAKEPNDPIQAIALRRTMGWASQLPTQDLLRSQLTLYKKPEAEGKLECSDFPRWLEDHIVWEWREHAARLNGLFDEHFIGILCKVLERPKEYMQHLLALTRNASILNGYVKKQPDDSEFRTMVDAFIISTLLRGRYHDCAADETGSQIMHHPIRRPVLRPLPKSTETVIQISNTEQYFSNILLAGAFAYRKPKDRIECWLESVKIARAGVAAQTIALDPVDYDDTALNNAIRFSKQLHIRTNTRVLEKVLDVFLPVGGTMAVTLLFHNWAITPLAALAAGYGRMKCKPGLRISRAVFERENRLRTLAALGPGRIEQG